MGGFATIFLPNLPKVDTAIMLASLGIAFINAPLEETLWRRLYIRAFPDRYLLGVVYPRSDLPYGTLLR